MSLWNAMWKLYDKKYGQTAKQIKALRKDVLRQQTRIEELQEDYRKLAIRAADLVQRNRGLEEESAHWEAKVDEMMKLISEPAKIDDNPY